MENYRTDQAMAITINRTYKTCQVIITQKKNRIKYEKFIVESYVQNENTDPNLYNTGVSDNLYCGGYTKCYLQQNRHNLRTTSNIAWKEIKC